MKLTTHIKYAFFLLTIGMPFTVMAQSLEEPKQNAVFDSFKYDGPLEIIDITGRRIEFVDSVMPQDAKICVAAAFTRIRDFDGFTPELVGNKYVSRGVKKQGYNCPISQSGCFSDSNGEYYIGKTNNRLYGSSKNYFEQNLIIDDFKINPHKPITRDDKMNFRCLAQIDDRLCIVQTYEPMSYEQFVETLHGANVKNALYLDMGDWKYGYIVEDNLFWDNYYDVNPQKDRTHKLIEVNFDPKQTNWIAVF